MVVKAMRRVIHTVPLLFVMLGCVGGGAQKKVDVGGYRLTVRAMGQGTPTVVFDAGLGDSKDSWRWIWPDVAKRTRVFVYDRAGLGRSDPGPLPRTSRQIVEELHIALDRAWVDGPYILVGHSFGGLNMQLFARTYPDEVTALVLIDPTPLEFPEWADERRTAEERRRLKTSLSLASETLRHERDALLRLVVSLEAKLVQRATHIQIAALRERVGGQRIAEPAPPHREVAEPEVRFGKVRKNLEGLAVVLRGSLVVACRKRGGRLAGELRRALKLPRSRLARLGGDPSGQ